MRSEYWQSTRVLAPLTVLAVCLLAAWSITQIGSTQSFWLVVLWAGWITAVIWTFTRASFSLPLAVIWAGMLMYVIIPATIHIVDHRTVIATDNFGAGTTKAVELSAIAQWATFGGAVLARAVWPASPLVRARALLSAERLDHAAIVALAVGGVGLSLDVVVGGADIRQYFFFSSQHGYASFYATSATTGHGVSLTLQLVGGLALIFAVLRVTSLSTSVTWLAPTLMVAASAVLLLGIGQRGRFLVPALAAGLIWFKTTHRRVPVRRVTVIALVAVLAFSAVVGIFRQQAGQRHVSLHNITFEAVGGGSELFAPLAGLVQTIPEQVSYLNGSSYLETLVFPVPRALWHAKPTGEIKRVTHVFDPLDNGVAFPEFGEMYANFGVLGVILGSILVGLLIEWFWVRLASTTDLRKAVLICVLYAVTAQVFFRGAFAPMLVTFLGLLLGTLFACRGSSEVFSPAEPSYHPTAEHPDVPLAAR